MMQTQVAVDGGSLSVEIAGAGKPVLVMLHGWTLDRRMWRHQVRGLSDCATLLLPDRRGFGRSQAPPGLLQEPDDILALLDHFGLASAILVAHSQAGRVALTAAARHPERVAGLVLLAAAHDAAPPDPVTEPALPFAQLVEHVRAGNLPAAVTLWRDHPMLRTDDAETFLLLDEMLADYQGRDLLSPPAFLPVTDKLLATITCPSLVMVGDLDTPSRMAAAHRLCQGLRRAAMQVFVRAGHMANISHAAAVNQAIIEYVTRNFR
ncbi:alpha/beta fold hydrolase [Niveispirillum cyanobacteriorum]|uniref:Uncharacterized protein n=1 Tax=Niveispirillum cyanobacteriorum TaxID=1612173 RepID=A0A2K9NJF4_9PROT|nr:alpha/beta hydrolase [Niveispirillum cyanobacteriorum]AUN33171.1 hypothetical protein C0V82_22540 [Niveispirillum cyanobacteriorum]GGE51096.1 hydrolase [Niveispirillum cyanobacteriorum]